MRLNLLKDPGFQTRKATPVFPVSSLSGKARRKIKTIICYRNSPTGAGRWREGEYGENKLRIGFRNATYFTLANLIIEIERMGRDDIALRIKKHNEVIGKAEDLIKRECTDKVYEAIPGLRDREGLLTGVAAREFDRCHSYIVSCFNVVAEDHLKIIDAEIDAILRFFGLTRHSKI